MSKYTIYLRRNTINGKVYIGQTKDFKQRDDYWKCLKWPYSKHIDADRELYGLDKFTVEILAEADCLEDAHELEKRFIADYNSVWPNGYNISTGGYSSSGVKYSEEIKQKMSEAKPKKPVYQYTLDGALVRIWSSTAECTRNGYDNGHVVSCCNGKRKTHKGYIWSYQPL